MTEPERVQQAIIAGDVSAQPADLSMHLGCCCTAKQREAVELVIVLGFSQAQASVMLRRNGGTVYKQIRAFYRKVKQCERHTK